MAELAWALTHLNEDGDDGESRELGGNKVDEDAQTEETIIKLGLDPTALAKMKKPGHVDEVSEILRRNGISYSHHNNVRLSLIPMGRSM